MELEDTRQKNLIKMLRKLSDKPGIITKKHIVCSSSTARINRAGRKPRKASKKVTRFGIQEEQLKNEPEIQLMKEIIHRTLIVSSPYACNNFDKHLIYLLLLRKSSFKGKI